MAPHYSYEIAKEVLNEGDKNRLLCLYLNCDPGTIDWAKATREFGAASVESMRVMTRTALKKIETAGGKEGVDASPAKTPASSKKRKGKAADNKDADDVEATPAPKKRGRPAKSAVAAKTEEAAPAEDAAPVEPEDDGNNADSAWNEFIKDEEVGK